MTDIEETAVAFTNEEARQAWDAGAESWDNFVESGADYYRTEVHGPGLLEVCGDVAGLRVLDVGCGQGWFSRQLARRGARVTGVDVSAELIRLARRHEVDEQLNIEYVLDDAANIHSRWESSSFDLVTACMSLHDMANPEGTIQSVSQILTVGGRFVFSVSHPATETRYREWERDTAGNKLSLRIDRYFESGTGSLHWDLPGRSEGWDTPRWYLTLSEWAAAIGAASLVIAGIHEPRPTATQVEHRPELDDCRRLPYFLILDCERAETT